jgi:hypothetical protein
MFVGALCRASLAFRSYDAFLDSEIGTAWLRIRTGNEAKKIDAPAQRFPPCAAYLASPGQCSAANAAENCDGIPQLECPRCTPCHE